MTEVLSKDEIVQLLDAINADDWNETINNNELNEEDFAMVEVLSQAEIDQLLTAIYPGLENDSFKSIEYFEKYILQKNTKPEKTYGIFDKDVSICQYFNSYNNENLLADIKNRNKENGYGNIKIPNTNIELLNYSFCSKCNTIFSYLDLVEYYKNPKPDTRFENRSIQYREDTRVCCHNCGTYFIPSLIISDGTPRNELQFLCRAQTVNAVEKYFLERQINVLTKKNENIVQNGNLRAIKNDVLIRDLEERPTLITNIIQYTPYKNIIKLIDGKNVEKGDLLFDEWKVSE